MITYIGNRGQLSSTSSAVESATSPTRSQSGMDVGSDASCTSSPSIQTPPATLPFPPGLEPSPTTSWADDIPIGLFPEIIVNNAQSTLPPLDDSAPGLPVTTNHRDIPDNLEDVLAELDKPDPDWGHTPTWEYADSHRVKTPDTPAPASGSLWDDYEEEKPVVQELLCADHGKICKKGICQTYAKQLRDTERAKKMAENSKGDRGKGKGKVKRGHGITNNWRRGSQGGSQEKDRPPASGGKKNDSNGTSTPVNGTHIDSSFPDDDDEQFSVVSGSKGNERSRPRANSITSAASGWGPISEGPW